MEYVFVLIVKNGVNIIKTRKVDKKVGKPLKKNRGSHSSILDGVIIIDRRKVYEERENDKNHGSRTVI